MAPRFPASYVFGIVASCVSPACLSQDEFFDLLITVPESCQQPVGNLSVVFPLEMPAEIDFLIGPKGVVRPIASIVNSDASGAGNQPALRVYKPGEYDLSSGIVDGAVRNRLVIDRALFCAVQYSIQIVYEITDRHNTTLPKIRAYIVPGLQQRTTLTPAARALSVSTFDRKYGGSLKYYVSDAFQWLEDSKSAREKSKNNSLYALNKDAAGRFVDCWNCWESVHSRALSLARLLNAADSKYVLRQSNATPLANWPGKFTFGSNRSLILDLGDAGTLTLREDEWNSSPTENRLLVGSPAPK